MDYQDWYEQYPSGGYSKKPSARRARRGVSAWTLILCMLATAALGGVTGGYFTSRYLRNAEPATLSAEASLPAITGAPASGSAGITASTAEAAGKDLSAPLSYTKAQIIEAAAPSVVGIDTTYNVSGYSFWGQQQSYQAQGSGSGVIISEDGYIVTCNHVVEGASTIKVVLNDDTAHDATLVGNDSHSDLAVIKIDMSGLPSAALGDSDMLTVGEDVIAIGNPLGELRGTSTSGIISALNRQVSVENANMTLLQTDAAISPGNSGGGLFNASGTLIGIVNAKASGNNSEGLGFAIPVNSVKSIISDLMDNGYVRGRAYLGVYTQNVTLQQGGSGWGSYFGGVSCVQVAQIVAGSAAEKAGIKVGDLITAVDDKSVSSNTDLSNLINAYNAGDTATITIQRDGAEQKLSVTFGEYNPTN